MTRPQTSKEVVSEQKDTTNTHSSRPSKPDFQSFAFKSDAAKRLKKEIESIGDELPNMVLVGDEGTHFGRICQDIAIQVNPDAHHFMVFINKKINVFDISKAIADIPESRALVFALTEAHHMGVAQKQALMKLHKRTGPFGEITNPVKFIFCLHEDLDTQFAKGAIDQDFYLIMGQKEIYIPRLDLCREDIPDLAKSIAIDLCSSKTVSETFGGFNSEATEILIQTEWPHNFASLEATVAKALKLAKGSTITRDHLEKAIAEPEPIASNAAMGVTSPVTSAPVSQQSVPSGSSIPKSTSTPTTTTSSSATPQTGRKEARISKPRIHSNRTPMIQSFTMLDDETELAKSILSKIVQ